MRIDTSDLYTVVRQSDIDKCLISKLPLDVWTEYEEARKSRMFDNDTVITVNQCLEHVKACCLKYPERNQVYA